MFPPLVRRCPSCGYVGFRRRFAAVDGAGSARRTVECPRCGHRFEPVDAPVLR